MNNMTMFDFNAMNIWAEPSRRRNGNFNVRVSLSTARRESGGSDRVLITFKNDARDVVSKYSYAKISSFSALGKDNFIVFQFKEKQTQGTWKLSKAKGTNSVYLQFTPAEADAQIFKAKWKDQTFDLKPIAAIDGMYYIGWEVE